MFRLFLCTLLLVLLAGCGSLPPATAARASALGSLPAVNATAQPSAQPTPAAQAPDQLVVRLEQSGGFAGRTVSYSIRADGSVAVGPALTRDAAQTLSAPSATALADLLNSIAASNITAVAPGDYSPENACCDRYAYTLTLSLPSGEYVYTTVEASQNQPAALADVLALVQEYIAVAQ